MAKIGNEAKLIIRLVRDRMDVKVAELQRAREQDGKQTEHFHGYRNAVNTYNGTLDEIVTELEGGK